jgi:metal-responsive CopG/Arc/MetJ family transcriptional regulator
MSPRDNETAISVKLDVASVEKLDRYAKKFEISRHQLLKNITELGLSQIKTMYMVGFLQIGVMLRDLLNPNPEVEETGKIEKSIPVYLDNDLVEKIDKYSKAAKINRQQLLRNIVHVGLDQLAILFNSGFAATYLTLEKVGDKIADLIKDGEKAHHLINDNKLETN